MNESATVPNQLNRLLRAALGLLVCLSLHLHSGTSALGAEVALDLVLPGGVTVNLQPEEALADGARWSLDGGAEQVSGFVQQAVAAGAHLIRFKSLAGWENPDPTTIQVVGGKTTSVNAIYRPRAAFYFRNIPAQTARAGSTLAFLVLAHDAGDPSSPPEGAPLTVSIQPAPSGPIHYDPVTGLFDYTPAASDRLPFELIFTPVEGGGSGSAIVQPSNSRVPEESVLLYQRPLPDPESRDFITITEEPVGTVTFNDALRATLAVGISGHTLVFENGHSAHLYDTLQGRMDIASLNLYADRVIIRSPLQLAQTHISIHARELRFEGAGSIDTTPKARGTKPDPAAPEDGLLQGRDGYPGHDAGGVDVLVESFHSDPTSSPRFVLRGGAGGDAGEGRNGAIEEDKQKNADDSPRYPYPGAAWTALMQRRGVYLCGTVLNGGPAVYSEEHFPRQPVDYCGVKAPPAGEAAVPAGRPGSGGNGGQIVSTLDLSSLADLGGGVAGKKGNFHVGGTFSGPFYYAIWTTTIDPRTHEDTTRLDSTLVHAVQGAPAAAPDAVQPIGTPGGLTMVTNSDGWLHSFSVRPVLAYAKECYLQNHSPEAHEVLDRYHNLILARTPVAGDPDTLDEEAFRENVNLDQLSLETGTLLHRIDSNLDYFGNPAGWVPMLSFEANFLAFQDEIEKSVPILYLSYWLNHAATNLQETVAASTKARDTLVSELAAMETSFNQAQDAIPRLRIQADSITRQISDYQLQLTNKLSDLQKRAQDNVDDRHKVPFWKKAIGTLSVIAELIPVGQPVLGQIGAGLGLLGQLDPDKPLESAKAIAPKAMDVFKQQNVSVCFGSGSTNKSAITGGAALDLLDFSSNAATNGGGKTLKQRIGDLAGCGKFLGDELKQLDTVFTASKADASEVGAELAKLEAADPEFGTLVSQLKDLNLQKEQFAKDLAASIQAVATLTSAMAQNVIGTHELDVRIQAGYDVLDHGALLHIKAMERRAKDRLLAYEYLMAQSFQYRRLQPFRGDLQLTRLFDRFEILVESERGHVLTDADFTTLKSLFVDELRSIIHDSFDNNNAPGVSNPITFRLTTNQLQQLNQTGRTSINLMDLGLISPQQEDVRIADLKTLTMPVHQSGGIPATHALLRVNYEHSGVSRLKSGGDTYLFRHYAADTINPFVWNTVFDGITGVLHNATPSPDDRSLISVLLNLDSHSAQDLQFFSLPGAWADILITKEVLADPGVDFQIDDLVVQVQFLFRNTSANLRELSVAASGDLTPVITINHADINGRQDGEAGFVRVFTLLSPVTVEAPASYGRFRFDGWNVNGHVTTNRSAVLPVVLGQNTRLEARYLPSEEDSSAIPRLRPIASAPGTIAFDFATRSGWKYTTEVSTGIGSPTWIPVDTRAADGSRIAVTRQVAPSRVSFFRVRAEP